MAAYAALCSLLHIIHQIQNHPKPPISLDKQQAESLTEKVTFLQEFLEGYSNGAGYSKEADPLESRIADAAHAAEDVIESYIVDRIHASHDFISRKDSPIHASHDFISSKDSTSSDQKISFFSFCKCFRGPRKAANPGAEDELDSHTADHIRAGSTSHGVKISSVEFYQGLQKVIEEMDSIMKEVTEIKEKTGVRDQQHMNSTRPADTSRPSSTWQHMMVGFDDALLEILDKLTGGDRGRQVIPIVGMGGMGKTTLARNVYVKPLIKQHFDIRAWTTISQEYNTREILREILCSDNKNELSDNIEVLGVELHKYLSGRRYLIVLDDMWSIEAWDEVSRFFPDNNNGSRIVITTRLSNLSSQLTSSYCLEMKFLDEDKSWNLLCRTVFGEEGCPVELEQIGKKITKNCRGLPLSIVVTGGLLVKSKHSREYWAYIAENLNSLVNLVDDERCLNILYLSYKQLPIYLKPCFLYMGVFSEDSMIRPKQLIRLWVAEGFLKPISGKCLEEIAEEYLKELIDRNLVFASRHFGKIRRCSMHDLLRDLCLREAQKERFYNVMKEHSLNDSKGISTERRIVVSSPGKFWKEINDELQSKSLVRSLIWEDGDVPLPLNCRLLRVLLIHMAYTQLPKDYSSLENMIDFVNSRYLAICYVSEFSKFPSSLCLLWNLQTLIILNDLASTAFTAPPEIWKMPQLRHIKFVWGLYLPDPPIDRNNNDIVLTNLKSLSRIVNFKCSEEVIQRIPNLKKLKIIYENVGGSSDYCLNNLDRLHKLESFGYFYYSSYKLEATEFLHELSFPHSLKKLTLNIGHFYWEEMMEKIGWLPLLEVLKLTRGFVRGGVWETVEDQFRSLKFLSISSLRGLENWNSESTHFPCLEQLVLEYFHDLKEIPSGIGEIPTLESIVLTKCSYSAIISAKRIVEEQEELGDLTLQVRVSHSNKGEKEALESLASPNFKVEYIPKLRINVPHNFYLEEEKFGNAVFS